MAERELQTPTSDILLTIPLEFRTFAATGVFTKVYSGCERFLRHPRLGFAYAFPTTSGNKIVKRSRKNLIRKLLAAETVPDKVKRRSMLGPEFSDESDEFIYWFAQLMHYGQPATFSIPQAKEMIRHALDEETLDVPFSLVRFEKRIKRKGSDSIVRSPVNSNVAIDGHQQSEVSTLQQGEVPAEPARMSASEASLVSSTQPSKPRVKRHKKNSELDNELIVPKKQGHNEVAITHILPRTGSSPGYAINVQDSASEDGNAIHADPTQTSAKTIWEGTNKDIPKMSPGEFQILLQGTPDRNKYDGNKKARTISSSSPVESLEDSLSNIPAVSRTKKKGRKSNSFPADTNQKSQEGNAKVDVICQTRKADYDQKSKVIVDAGEGEILKDVLRCNVPDPAMRVKDPDYATKMIEKYRKEMLPNGCRHEKIGCLNCIPEAVHAMWRNEWFDPFTGECHPLNPSTGKKRKRRRRRSKLEANSPNTGKNDNISTQHDELTVMNSVGKPLGAASQSVPCHSMSQNTSQTKLPIDHDISEADNQAGESSHLNGDGRGHKATFAESESNAVIPMTKRRKIVQMTDENSEHENSQSNEHGDKLSKGTVVRACTSAWSDHTTGYEPPHTNDPECVKVDAIAEPSTSAALQDDDSRISEGEANQVLANATGLVKTWLDDLDNEQDNEHLTDVSQDNIMSDLRHRTTSTGTSEFAGFDMCEEHSQPAPNPTSFATWTFTEPTIPKVIATSPSDPKPVKTKKVQRRIPGF